MTIKVSIVEFISFFFFDCDQTEMVIKNNTDPSNIFFIIIFLNVFLDYICSNSYTIGFNYASCRFKNLNQVFYIDTRVKKYLDTIKGQLKKSNTRVTTHHNRKLLDVYKKKYISAERGGDIVFMKYNLSITTLLRMLESYYPRKKFLIFGGSPAFAFSPAFLPSR